MNLPDCYIHGKSGCEGVFCRLTLHAGDPASLEGMRRDITNLVMSNADLGAKNPAGESLVSEP